MRLGVSGQCVRLEDWVNVRDLGIESMLAIGGLSQCAGLGIESMRRIGDRVNAQDRGLIQYAGLEVSVNA